MTDLHFLIPKAPLAAVWIVAAVSAAGFSATYHDTITLGSILVSALVIVLGGAVTLRNNLKTFWKDLAEERAAQISVLEQHLKEKAAELVAAELRHTEQMAAFSEEQREVRHQLKNEAAELRIVLEAERAKHDLTSVVNRLDEVDQMLIDRTPMFTRMVTLLEEIRDQLKPPIPAIIALDPQEGSP